MLAVAYEHKATMPENVKNLVSFRIWMQLWPVSLKTILMWSIQEMPSCILLIKTNFTPKFFSWLKPGGQVVVSEYAHGRNYPNFTTEYVDYIKDRGYQLVTVQEYGNVLRRCGFKRVEDIDK